MDPIGHCSSFQISQALSLFTSSKSEKGCLKDMVSNCLAIPLTNPWTSQLKSPKTCKSCSIAEECQKSLNFTVPRWNQEVSNVCFCSYKYSNYPGLCEGSLGGCKVARTWQLLLDGHLMSSTYPSNKTNIVLRRSN